jgi:hypothetical protein
MQAALVFDNSRMGNGLLDSPGGRYKELIRFSFVRDSQYSSPRHPTVNLLFHIQYTQTTAKKKER